MKRGLPDDAFEGKPMIGICNSASELTPCNQHLRRARRARQARRLGVRRRAVGVSRDLAGEPLIQPTAMLLRNLMAMDVEESIRCNPLDGVVLLAGCDKTTPALVMGAASVDLPTIMITGGPMLSGAYRGSDSDRAPTSGGSPRRARRTDHGRGVRGNRVVHDAQPGHCKTMGTASTMASMVEALGLTLPDNAAIPATDSRRRPLAHLTGRRIVEMVADDLRPSKMLTRPAFENVMRVPAAIGGSTNAVIHLLAIARRVGVELDPRRLRPHRLTPAAARQRDAVRRVT